MAVPAERELIGVVTIVNPSREVWGAEHSMIDISDQLQRLGVDVCVVGGSHVVLDRVVAQNREVRTSLLEMRGKSMLERIRFFDSARRRAPSGSTILLWDIVSLVGAALARRQIRSKRQQVVMDLHNSYHGVKLRIFRLLASYAVDRCVAVSDYIAEPYRAAGVKVATIHRPVQPRWILRNQPAMVQERLSVAVGVVGRVVPGKRVHEAIPVVAALDDGVILRIRGAAPEDAQDYLRTVIKDGQDLLGERFFYDGRVNQEELFQGIDVLLHLNEDEPSGRTVVEAQLAGVPVVVPSSGGAAEFVAGSSVGEAFDIHDRVGLLSVLRRVAMRAREGGYDAATIQAQAKEAYDPVRQAKRYGSWILYGQALSTRFDSAT